LRVDDDVPPRQHEHERHQRKGNQRGAAVLDQAPVGKATFLRLDRQGAGRRKQRCERPDQHVLRISRLEASHPVRNGDLGQVLRQGWRDLRSQDRPAEDVYQIQERQEETREHRGRIELHDRLAGNGGVDDDHDRRRDQDPERPACSDDAGRELHVVAGSQHGIERDHAHQHDHGADQAAGNAPEGADEERRDRQRRRHAPERKLDAVEHLVDQRAALHDVAHEHEQRDADQDIVGHRAVGAVDHQVEDAVVEPALGRIVERVEAEEHAEAHQREGRREAHDDDHHDEREHQ
jgi:hypothetical protein